ncbi:glycosyltransferase, partial [Shewanella algae]|uniref:glycosyltransferase n=1 Tax=Shewanella algae TaxID=38313 RepID=UPI00313BA2CB
LSEADIFMLPSYAEGMPNSLMEAMASGVAGIATNVGAVEELILNEETGMLIQVKDPVGLRQALRQLIDDIDLRRHIVVQARKKIETNHSLES